MATVKEVNKVLSHFSDAKVTKAIENPNDVHVEGFVTCIDLKALVERYKVFLHEDGALCVG